MSIKKTAITGFEANTGTPASLLLNFNGVNGSSAFVDSSPNCLPVTANGNAVISTTQSKWGGSSGYFDGGSYLRLNKSFDWNSDFTLEAWVYRNSLGGFYPTIFEAGDISASQFGPHLHFSSDAIVFTDGQSASMPGPVLNSNQWYHIAVVRDAGVNKLFVDGVLVGSQSFPFSVSSDVMTVGAAPNYSMYFDGYIDNLRLTPLAVYTSNFIPPRGPLTPYAKPEPVAAQASLLLHFDGNFNDSSGNNKYVTLGGNAALSAAQSKFGGYSAYFDGNSNYLLIDTTSSENFESQNWTTELWFYPNSTAGEPRLLSRQDINTGFVYQLRIYNSAPQVLLRKGDGSDYLEVGGGIVVEENKWHHVAVVRNGNNVSLYVDGILDQTIAISGAYSSPLNAPWIIGAFADTSLNVQLYFSGYIDDLRITKGVAVYTKNFNPPIAPLTPVAEQDVLPSIPASLLLRFDGADNSTNFKDSSVNALTVTANGNAKISTAQSKWGESSGYFDGSSAYVALGAAGSTLHGAADDFTIECWVWPEQFSSLSTTIFGTRPVSPFEDNCLILALDGDGQPFVHTNATALLAGAAIALQQWTHLALTRQGNTFRLFANGVLLAQATNSLFLNSTETALLGWEPRGEREKFVGYIDDFRIVKGHAVYTDNFTPPTAPVDPVVRPPEGTAASLLLHFDGDFSDSSGKGLTVTANVNATTSVAQSKFGGASAYFDGNSYLSLSSDAFSFGANDFTIEFWAYIQDDAGYTYAGQWGGSTNAWFFGMNEFYINSPPGICSYATPSLDSWHHMAACRENGTIRIFTDGEQVASANVGSVAINSSDTFIGICGDQLGNTKFMGYIDDLRITKGLAVYTGPFIPPEAPLSPIVKPKPVEKQTSLLLHFDGNFNDSSENNLTVTANGSATTSATQSKFGGSGGYFDGIGYLSIASSDIQFGGGDFTIEFWLYPADTQGAYATVIGKGEPSSVGNDWIYAELNSDATAMYVGDNFSAAITATIVPNIWQHIAIVKHGELMELFVDGVSAGTRTAPASYDNLGDCYIGTGSYDTSRCFSGYIDDLRIVKGLAIYTGNFIPPEAPLSPIAKPKPVEAQASLLLHFNGANGSAAIVDSSTATHTVHARGNGALTTADYKFGSSALAGGYISVDTPSWTYGDKDWTIELWFKITNIADSAKAVHGLFGHRANDYSETGVLVSVDKSDSKIKIFIPGSGNAWSSPVFSSDSNLTVIENQWHHFALVRNGSTLTPYLDGLAGTSWTLSGSIYSAGNFNIGAYSDQAAYAPNYGDSTLTGFVDECRVVVGMAVYTGPFTPPKKPLDGIASPVYSPPTVSVDYLVVAGGGSGGVRGGGGGAGGYLESTALSLTANTPVTVTVGAGGASVGPPYYDRGNNGSDSVLGDITAIGGGGGGGLDGTGQLYSGGPQNDGANGGSGGGGGVGWYHGGSPGYGTIGQGNDGGAGTDTNNAQYESCGGGGGAGWPGGAGTYGDFQAGDGGYGWYSTLTGSYFAGGGGGGANPDTYAWGAGGLGGGGGGAMAGYAENGAANTGGGGGGCSYNYGDYSGDGGSGYVCIRFPNTHTLTVGPGLTYTTYDDGTNIAYYFTAGTDTITFTS